MQILRMVSSTTYVIVAVAVVLEASWRGAVADPVSSSTVARATKIPACTSFVDAAAKGGDGTAEKPFRTIAKAIATAAPAAVICVAQGVYLETLSAGEKDFTLSGGFQSGKNFKIRDSATFVSKAQGKGGSFLRIQDPGPKGDQLTAIDGFEITGYARAILREFYESQRFDITNNFIHDNICTDLNLVGSGFALENVSGTIRGNVIQNNSCGRGGAGFLNDAVNSNTVLIENNWIDGNSGMEPTASHGGGLYLFGNTLKITGNLITNNYVTQWGGGLYIGAFTPGNQPTTATLSHNVYRGNRAGARGGGFFCDDGATCNASYEVYDRNCGGNVMVDGGSAGSGPTITKFDHITNVGARTVDCKSPGTGVMVDNYEAVAPDFHKISNSIFWGNAPNADFSTACSKDCAQLGLSVINSMVQTKYEDGSVKIVFGAGNIAPADPLFVAPGSDFHLSAASPAIGKGAYPKSPATANAGSTTTVPVSPQTAAPPAVVANEAKPMPKAATAEVSRRTAVAQSSEVPVKQAFDEAKALNTVEGWNAFLQSYSDGFYANLARAYLTKLERNGSAPTAPETPTVEAVAPKEPASAPQAAAPSSASGPPSRTAAAVTRGGQYMGFVEKFNRYYTDPAWKPSKIVYVSESGNGNGTSRASPMPVQMAVASAKPGTLIYFLRGTYQGGIEFSKEMSGTYDAPIVLFGERNDDKMSGVDISCAVGLRKTCINFEGANYIAVDGFMLHEGNFGVRAVGLGYAASEHSIGIAVLNSKSNDQYRDPFFTGQSDWAVFESNVGSGAKKGDGHGIYISNGSDWNIVRFNETFGGDSSDFQINASPIETCQELKIPFDDPRCDAYAGTGEGGQGASDYMLIDGNFFHHSNGPGANFTSVRRSMIRNNIFGLHTSKHNVSFWQETDNPKLGSSDNKIYHNLFITTGRHGVAFIKNSTRNEFANNIIMGVTVAGGAAAANPKALLMEVDDSVGENIYRGNLYASGRLDGREPNDTEVAREDWSPQWFKNFPSGVNHNPNDFSPTAAAPFRGTGKLLADAPLDRNGAPRSGKVDLGPIRVP